MTAVRAPDGAGPPRRPLSRLERSRAALLNLSDLPQWMRDNDYLRTAYRPPQPSVAACVRTGLLRLTNDTVNIYTHLVAFLVLIPVAYHLAGPSLRPTTVAPSLPACGPDAPGATLDVLRRHGLLRAACLPLRGVAAQAAGLSRLIALHRHALLPLLLGGLMCLAFSAAYHLFWVLSPRASATLAKLDFLGIAVLCVGHALTGVFHAFYCRPQLAAPFYPFIAGSLALTIPAIFSPSFATPRARPFRTFVFSALGSTSLLPVVRAALVTASFEDRLAVVGALVSLAIYGVGATIYVARFPECCRVGKHDRFLSSHQIMHVAVVAGLAVHLSTCVYLAHYRLLHGCDVS